MTDNRRPAVWCQAWKGCVYGAAFKVRDSGLYVCQHCARLFTKDELEKLA